MGVSIRASARAAAGPVCGFVLVYVVFVLIPGGQSLDVLAYQAAMRTGWHVRRVDMIGLETISAASVGLALATLVVIGGLRGQWRTALRSTLAVLGALLSAELLKHLLPSENWWDGQWRWLKTGSFPSGHTVVVTSISLAVLSVSSPLWRRRLLGPLVACTAIATTGLVTIGWHRPSDVLASFFLATAWHRALAVRPASTPASRDLLRSGLPRFVLPRLVLPWWVAACVLVLGAAVDGVLTHTQPSRHAALAYLAALVLVLLGALITLVVARIAPPGDGPEPDTRC